MSTIVYSMYEAVNIAYSLIYAIKTWEFAYLLLLIIFKSIDLGYVSTIATTPYNIVYAVVKGGQVQLSISNVVVGIYIAPMQL